MVSDWLLIALFVVYPLVIVGFNRFIRSCIPCKKSRKNFLRENEYINKLLYLLIPLMVLHLELMLLNTDYPFDEINAWMIILLVVLQCYLFTVGIIYFLDLFVTLNKGRNRMEEG